MVEISLERGVWSTFEKKETAYRASQIPGKLVVFSEVELPDLSTLHTVTGFLDLVHPPKDQVMPDLSLPPIANERWPVYFRSWTMYAGQDATPFPVLDKLPYTGARYIPLINKIYANNRRIHRLMAESALSQMKNALLCFDYAPLLQARLPGGTLSEYRKFDALFRTILDKIVDSNDSRHHFLTLPMSMTPYSTSFIEPSFSQITASTIKAHTDPSFFFLVHLIGFLYAQEKPLSVKPFKKEVSLREARDKDAAPLELISTSLFTRLDPSILDKINVVLYCGEKCIIYNLGALRQMALSTSGMYRRVLRHINIMKLSAGDDLAEHQMLTAEPADVDQKIEESSPSHDTKTEAPSDVGVTTSPKTAPDNKDAPSEIVSDKSVSKVQDPADMDAPKSPAEKPIIRAFTPIKPVTVPPKQSPSKTIPTDTKPQRPTTYTTDPSTFVTHITTGLQDSVDRVETKDRDKLDKKTEQLLNQHMAVELGGKPLGHYAAHVEDPSVSSNALDFLKDKLPEPSQANGRITAFDPTYLKEMYHKDLANTLTALVNHGFFVKALEESPEVTHLTRIMHYKVSLVDINGKNHTIQFKLPMIDEMGYMYTDGVKTRMVIQEINKPICKISPTRVNLSSNFNKTLVEKHKSEKHTYQNWIASYLVSLRSEGLVTLTFGTFPLGAQVIPYEYAAISRKFTSVSFAGFSFTFDLLHRFSDLPKGIDEKTLVGYEESLGVYCGRDPQGHLLMWDMQDNIHQIDLKGNHIGTYGTFIDILDHAMTPLGYPPPPAVSEWVTLKILDIDIPMVYTLGYRFGLKSVLDDLGATYRVLDKSEKFTLANDEVAIPFSDSTLILNRYPFQAFLIGAGLLRYKTKSYPFLAFEDKDIYFKVFQDNGIKINYLRGIDDFFTYFLDPITLSVLEHIHEPTTVKGLLYRATQMLCTMNYLEASSAAHHRFRGAERSASTLYNELFRALADYNNRRGQNKSLSINPEAVFQRLRSDSTNVMVDTTNPIHEIKEISHVSFSGSGGRTSRAFVVNDRRFSKDSVGVLSEATPDSGKVAITAYTSIDPRIENIRGLLTPNENNETPLDATNILSVTGNLMPGGTQDDRK